MIAEEKRVFANLMELKIITMYAYSFLVIHGYINRAGKAWGSTTSILYHMFLIRQGHELMETVSFAYGWGLKTLKKRAISCRKFLTSPPSLFYRNLQSL